MQKYLKNIYFIIFIQILGWSLFFLLKHFGINYIDNYLITSIHFLIFNLIIILYFKDIFLEQLKKTSKLQWTLFGIFTIFTISLFIILGNKNNQNEMLIFYNSFYLATFKLEYLLTKSFEILFQQLAIFIIIYSLNKHKISHNKIYLIFLVCFPLIHLVNFIYTPFLGALLLQIGSILAGFIFPFILLHSRAGFIQTYILHWSFYLFVEGSILYISLQI